jgi:hypothetical protein
MDSLQNEDSDSIVSADCDEKRSYTPDPTNMSFIGRKPSIS